MKKVLYLSVLLIVAASAVFAARHPAKHTAKAVKNRLEEGTKIKLTLGDKTYDIQLYSLSAYYADKVNDKPKTTDAALSYYSSNSLSITLRTSKVDQALLDWMLSPEPQIKDARMVVYDGESDKVIRTLTFTGVRPGSYSENNGSNTYGYGNAGSLLSGFGLKFKTVSIKI